MIQDNLPPPDGATWAGTQIRYWQPYWSPDGRRIVVTFEVYVPGAPHGLSHGRGDGIVVLDNRLSAIRIFAGLSGITPLLGRNGNFGPQTVEWWDLSAGKASAVMVPMGLAYTWSADDGLFATSVVPQTPDAPPPAISSGPVGNPLGGRAFTLWQNGDVVFADGTGCSGAPSAAAPNYYLTFLNTSAWSPDGRYLALYVRADGRLPLMPPLPSPFDPSSCTNFGPATQWPQLPVHDAGMRAALALVNGTDLQSIQIAWSPDGKRLAIAPGDVAGGTAGLTVYDCASGQVRLRLSVAAIVSAQAAVRPFDVMAWSPDSTRLLLVPQGPLQIIHVLGPKRLGG